VTSADFEQWIGPGSPQFTVTFNQRMSLDALRSRLFFQTEAGARFPAVIEPADPQVPEPERYWRVRPQRELPPDITAHLVAAKGLASLDGPLPSAEDNRVVSLFTFPSHGFLGIRCSDNAGNAITLRPSESLPGRPCNPMALAEVLFSGPGGEGGPAGAPEAEPTSRGREDYDPDRIYSYSRLEARSEDETYPRSFPAPRADDVPAQSRARRPGRVRRRCHGTPPRVHDLGSAPGRLTHPVSTLERTSRPASPSSSPTSTLWTSRSSADRRGVAT
jgi:hypothetical protein